MFKNTCLVRRLRAGMPKIKVWEVTHHLGLGVDVVLLLGLGGHLHSGAVIVHWSTRRTGGRVVCAAGWKSWVETQS